jgi:hypothetical protein
MPSPRRFPPPWTIEEANDACFIVKDHNGQALAYINFENEPGRRAAANLLTKDEAQSLAAHIAERPLAPRKQRDWQGVPPLIIAQEYLMRARRYREEAIKLDDIVTRPFLSPRLRNGATRREERR